MFEYYCKRQSELSIDCYVSKIWGNYRVGMSGGLKIGGWVGWVVIDGHNKTPAKVEGGAGFDIPGK